MAESDEVSQLNNKVSGLVLNIEQGTRLIWENSATFTGNFA